MRNSHHRICFGGISIFISWTLDFIDCALSHDCLVHSRDTTRLCTDITADGDDERATTKGAH
jgi:hypothetical protein